jgi:hypothetical protein
LVLVLVLVLVFFFFFSFFFLFSVSHHVSGLMDTRGWIVLSDGVSSVNFWRWSVVEHYSLDRWLDFMRASFPLVKGYAIGSKFFSVPSAAELLEWGERRVGSELDALRDSLAKLPGKEVHVFVK